MRAGVTLLALALAVPSPDAAAPGSADAVVSGHVEDGTPVAEAAVTPPPGGADAVVGGHAREGAPAGEATPRRPVDGRGGSGEGGGSGCVYRRLGSGEAPTDLQGRPRPAPAGMGWAVRDCSTVDSVLGRWTVVPVADAADLEALARRAVRRLRLAVPRVGVSPPAEGGQLVNLPTWLWVVDRWEPRSATASVPGASVTVTAAPRAVVWDMGTGERVVCRGPGTPYAPGVFEEAQSTGCSYTFRSSSAGQPGQRYQVTATMVWAVSWTAAGAPGGGDLGEVSRSTSFGLRVGESQALVVADEE